MFAGLKGNKGCVWWAKGPKPMAEYIEYILRSALGDHVFRRVEVTDHVDEEGNDIRRVFVFYDDANGALSGETILRANSALRKHFFEERKGSPVVSYLTEGE